jgi:hypothetical protein
MEVNSVTIPYEHRGQVFTIYPIGDIHAGTRQCDEGLLDSVIARVKADPYARWFGLGDYCDFINMHDKRFDLRNLSPWLLKAVADAPLKTRDERSAAALSIASMQVKRVAARLEVIKDKCLGLTVGNHEEAIRLAYDDPAGYALAQILGVPNLGYCSYNKVTFRRNGGGGSSLVVYIHHGYFASRLMGAIKLNLGRLLDAHPEADVVLVGHAHQRDAYPKVAPHICWGKAKPFGVRRRYAILSGPFKRAYSLPGELPVWEERMGYPMNDLGPVRFTYNACTRETEAIL